MLVALQNRFVARVRITHVVSPDDQPWRSGLSARNVIRGTLAEVATLGATVVAAIDAGPRFVVHLTPSGLESLGLRTGDSLWLVIKTYSCRLVAG